MMGDTVNKPSYVQKLFKSLFEANMKLQKKLKKKLFHCSYGHLTCFKTDLKNCEPSFKSNWQTHSKAAD